MELIAMRHQRGFSLFVTLIILTIVSISTIAMVRMVNSGTSAAGNIAFRQASLRVADAGVLAARNWILARSASDPLSLGANIGGAGYFAYTTYTAGKEDFVPAAFDWETNGVKYYDPFGGSSTALFNGGYQVYYVIHRLARPSDMAASVNGGGACSVTATACASPPQQAGVVSGEGQTQSVGSGYNAGIQIKPGLVYYRVTIKVTGPLRNTSYVQAYLY
jgi:hypothetical protein